MYIKQCEFPYRLLNFDDTFGELTLENHTRLQFSISKSILELTGPLGIWYRSLLLKDNAGNTICSTIMVRILIIILIESRYILLKITLFYI